jgi:hypothetical protein
MRQRGRKSAAQLAINNVDGTPPRLATPTGLNTKERVVFEALIASTDPRHFRKSDIPLIVAFTQATLLSHRLGRNAARTKEWETATRTLIALSTKLRLNPHSRADAKTIGRMEPPSGLRKPWEMKLPTDASYDVEDDDDEETLQ